MASDPTTVTRLVSICTTSVAMQVLTTSMSYETRLMMSPAWFRSKYPTGSRMSLRNTSPRIFLAIHFEMHIIIILMQIVTTEEQT